MLDTPLEVSKVDPVLLATGEEGAGDPSHGITHRQRLPRRHGSGAGCAATSSTLVTRNDPVATFRRCRCGSGRRRGGSSLRALTGRTSGTADTARRRRRSLQRRSCNVVRGPTYRPAGWSELSSRSRQYVGYPSRFACVPTPASGGLADRAERTDAELESVLGATPQGFESLILRPRNQHKRQSFDGADRHARLVRLG